MDDNYLKIFKELFFNIEENEDVKEIIEQSSWVLASIITKFGELQNEISYGTSRQHDFVDTVICLFIRKIMEQLDAINVLFSVGSLTQAQIILRALIENIITLKFILKEDTEKRAASYYLEHHYQEIELGVRYFNKNSKYEKLILAQMGEEQFNSDCQKYRKKKEAFQRIIKSKEIFQKVDEARNKKVNEKKKKKNKKVYVQWYEVCSNVSNFYQLMKETGYEKYYQGIYGGLSNETHALNSAMGMSVDENGICLKRIRNLEEGSSTLSIACTFSVSVLNEIYNYLNDGEDERKEFEIFFLDFQKKRDIACQNLDMIKSSQNN